MKKQCLFLFLLAICQFPVISQSIEQLRIDSLQKVLPGTAQAARVDLLNEVASVFMSLGQKDSMYHYAVQANQEALKIGYQRGQGMSLVLMAEYEIFSTQSLSAAQTHIDKSISIGKAIQDHQMLGRAYLTGSNIYRQKGEPDELLKWLKTSQGYFQKVGDQAGEFEATTWLCMLYANQGKYVEGFDHCHKCVQMAKATPPKPTAMHHHLVQWSFINMSELYSTAGDYQTSMEYLQKSDRYATANNTGWNMTIDISEMFYHLGQYDSALMYWNKWKKNCSPCSPGHEAWGNNILGQIYLRTKKYDEALKILETSNERFRKMGTRNVALLRSLLLTAEAYKEKKIWNTALKYATEGLDRAKKENIRPSVMKGHELLSEIYHHLGKDDKAYANLLRYTLLKDSLHTTQFLWRLNSYKKAAEDEKKKASIELLNKENDIKDEQLKHELLLKRFLLGGLILLILISFFIFRTLRLKQKNEKLQRWRLENELTVHRLESDKQQAELRQRASELEMQALRAQMSPHFIFNCLSSINRFILKNESEAASDYLTRFSRLIRRVLTNSKKPLISLEDELEMLRLYIEMERLRFKDSFDFNIIFTNEIDTSEVFIPPLLLQPFAENAIWHGLMNKQGHGRLDISFTAEESTLTCSITDNGVGRKEAEEFKSKKDVKRKSMGLKITTDRLAKLNNEDDRDTFFEVEDLYDEAGQAAGTKVILKIRLEYAIREVLADQDNYS